MAFETVFAQAREQIMKADVVKEQGVLAYQFNLTGESEGKFYIEVRDGRLSVEPYEYNDRSALFICDADALMELVSGKTDLTVLLASGRLRVEGKIEQALKLRKILKKENVR